ncbi:MAG: PAS domain S-box protein [Bacteroidia bacterium]
MKTYNYDKHINTHLNSNRIGILAENPSREVIFTNDTFYRLFGMPAGTNLVGANCAELLKDAVHFFKKPDEATHFINQALEERVIQKKYPIFSANNQAFQLTYVPVFENDIYLGHIWEYENLTEQYQKDQELAFRQKMFNQLFNSDIKQADHTQIEKQTDIIKTHLKDIHFDKNLNKYLLAISYKTKKEETYKYADVSELLEFISIKDTIHQNQQLVLSEFPISIFHLDVQKGKLIQDSLKFVGGNIKLVTGFEEEEFYQKGVDFSFKNVNPESIESLVNAYESILNSTKPVQVEFQWKVSTGQYNWLRIQALYFPVDQENGYLIGIVEDINSSKLNQEKLKQQDLLFSAILDNLNDIVIQVDTNLIITYANKRCETITGWSPNELIGKSVSHFSSKIDDIIQAEILSFYPEIRNFEGFEFPLSTKFQKYIWVKINAKPLVNAKNEITGITCSISSIQDVKDYQNELNKVNVRLHGISQNTFESNIVINLIDKKVEYVSSNYKTITGIDLQVSEEGFNEFEKIIHPDDYDWYTKKFISDIENKVKSRILKFRITQKNGKVIWVRESAIIRYNNDGIPSEYSSAITDISSLIEAERKAKENFEKFRIIAENSKDMVSLVNLNGVCEFVSGSVQNFGYQLGDFDGQKIFNYIYAEDVELVSSLFSKQELNDLNEIIEFRILKKDGNPVWVEANLSVFQDVEFHPLGLVLNIRDISERKKRMEEVQFKNNLVQAISEAQLAFINSSNPGQALGIIMDRLIELTGSEFGFIGEVQTDSAGIPSLLTHFLTDISWDDKHRKMYNEAKKDGLRFSNLNTLFGHTIKTGEMLISNHPKTDPKSGGLPLGHPPLNSYLGMPLFSGDKLIGMVGLANRPAGYDLQLIETFKPIWTASASIIQSYLHQKKLRDTKLELESSEGQLKAILTSMEDLVLELNKDVEIVQFWNNESDSSQLKIGLEIGRKLKDFDEPFQSDSLHQVIKEVFDDGKTRVLELCGTKDNNLTWYQFKISRIADSNQPKVSMLIQDISNRKNVEKEVERLKDFYELLLNNLPIDVVVLSRNHTYLYVNHKAISDAERREWVIGKDDFDYSRKYGLPMEYVLARRNMFNHVIQHKEMIEFEEEYKDKFPDGSSKWVLRFFTPIIDSKGEVDHILGFGLDITERKRAELDILTNLDRQKELNELKNKFVSTISHEFRTPLATIRSSMDLMDLYTDKKDIQILKIKDFIGVVNNEIQILTSLLNDVLLLGRHEARQTPFHPKKNNLMLVLQNVINQNFRFVKNQHIHIQSSSSIMDSEFDEKLISHILSNMISNAIKYSEEDVLVDMNQNKEESIISIKDKGIGIPHEDIHKLFNSFFRASNSQDFQGTGLGLVIVKNFVEMHNGKIEVISEEGKGSEFIITLPNQLS